MHLKNWNEEEHLGDAQRRGSCHLKYCPVPFLDLSVFWWMASPTSFELSLVCLLFWTEKGVEQLPLKCLSSVPLRQWMSVYFDQSCVGSQTQYSLHCLEKGHISTKCSYLNLIAVYILILCKRDFSFCVCGMVVEWISVHGCLSRDNI